LVERGLVGPGVDQEQRISLLHRLALFEEGLHDLAVHPALHIDGLDRLHCPERADNDRHVLSDDGRRDDWNGCFGERAPLGDPAGTPSVKRACNGGGCDNHNH
jgi:hypothetical protein